MVRRVIGCAGRGAVVLMLHFDVCFPHVHDLGLLLDEFEKGGITIPDEVRECVDLTPYSISL